MVVLHKMKLSPLLAAALALLLAPVAHAGEKKKQERKAQKQLEREQRETNCYDNDVFEDEQGNTCKFWTDLDCAQGATALGFSSHGEVDLLQNCCRTCFMVGKENKGLTPSPTLTPAPTPVGWTPAPTTFWLNPGYPYGG